MVSTFVQPTLSIRSKCLPLVGALLYLLAGCLILQEYLSNHPLVWAALATLPFLLNVRQPGRLSFRYGIIAVALLGLSYTLPVRTLYFLAAGFAALFCVESQAGRINYLP